MIEFLLKGLIRDKSRSSLPVIVVTLGVMLTVLMHAYIKGFMGDTVELNARFSNGHVKVMTYGYSENPGQNANDLALMDSDSLMHELTTRFPGIQWVERIQFGGLADVPDITGETRAQGPVLGIGLDLLSPGTLEPDRLNLEKSLARGKMPEATGEILLSDDFSVKLGTVPGDTITFIGATVNGSMSFFNFVISGTVSFGNEILDRGALIADIRDARQVLDLYDSSGEILGFFGGGFYDDDLALQTVAEFNPEDIPVTDEYAPVMRTLSQQGNMGQYVMMAEVWANYVALVFIIAMSLVLWNAGLLGGLRRYGEIGVRLAMGEEKGHIFRTLIYESVMTGIAGSIAGTSLGLLLAWLIQKYGIDISGMMKGASVMMPSEIRARITPPDYYIGFIPGLISTVLGTMLSGIGVYKRQTAQLFKELEA